MRRNTGRDRSVEQLLRRSLRDSGAPGSDSCLDAETLAAWIDGGLDDRALMMAEAHASGCARCQALVGIVARSAPDVPMPAPWWRREWHLRWLVPLSASAAAIALWMVVPGERSVSPPQRQAESQARAEAPAPPTATAPGLTQRAPATPAPTDQLQAQTSEAKRERRDAPAATPGRAAKDEMANSRKAPETARQEARGKVAGTPPAAERDAAAAPAAPAATFRTAQTPDQQQRRLGANQTREIASPDPAIRWRLSGAGSVEYSINGGATWEPLSTGVSAELTAGSSPSASVCWLVGRVGTILLTTDGRRWQRVPFPEPADLASIQATDSRRATVTTTDGRVFRTEDAGQTWSRLSPQDW